ncbi:MAG: sugar transferase, partial [Patescibacteria group bacterium]
MKRPFDIAGAVLGLLFIAPFTPFIALAIMLESGGPVFVRLPRVSAGRIVKVRKFRSMIRNAHALKPTLVHLNERTDGPL